MRDVAIDGAIIDWCRTTESSFGWLRERRLSLVSRTSRTVVSPKPTAASTSTTGPGYGRHPLPTEMAVLGTIGPA